MATSRKFKFALSVLVRNGQAILAAAGKYATQLAARLPAIRVTQLLALHKTVADSSAAKTEKTGEVGDLTQVQNNQIRELNRLMGQAREFAKRAFKGNDVKLRDQFQVGINEPNDLASVEARARIVLASCQQTDNAAALTAKGWLATDTQALVDALGTTETADETQETGKSEGKGDTDAVNVAANDLYDGLLDIQTVANFHFPAGNPAHTQVRDEFKLNSFPPKPSGGDKKKPEPPKPPQ